MPTSPSSRSTRAANGMTSFASTFVWSPFSPGRNNNNTAATKIAAAPITKTITETGAGIFVHFVVPLLDIVVFLSLMCSPSVQPKLLPLVRNDRAQGAQSPEVEISPLNGTSWRACQRIEYQAPTF